MNEHEQIYHLQKKVLDHIELTREEALTLCSVTDVDTLSEAANDIRETLCGNDFDMCGVLSIKNGRCSENCRFCPQSSIAVSEIHSFSLLDGDIIVREGAKRAEQGVRHYCLVSNGRKIRNEDLTPLCESIRRLITETDLKVCVSLGLLDADQLKRLKETGVSRIHNNLETSRQRFASLCTTHSYDEKLTVVQNAHAAGLEVCCGGILGVDESWEDRVDLALQIRRLRAESVPINLLNAYPGTPLEHQKPVPYDDVRKTIALFRFLVPTAYIRLAAGRPQLHDTGLSCFRSGANAAITGDMLNVSGITVESDLQAIRKMGYQMDR